MTEAHTHRLKNKWSQGDHTSLTATKERERESPYLLRPRLRKTTTVHTYHAFLYSVSVRHSLMTTLQSPKQQWMKCVRRWQNQRQRGENEREREREREMKKNWLTCSCVLAIVRNFHHHHHLISIPSSLIKKCREVKLLDLKMHSFW